MGNEQSGMADPSGGGVRAGDARLPLTSYGFQVLRVADKSLAKDSGLEPYFDYIVGLNGHKIEDGNAELFAQEIRNCAGGSVKFAVFSAKGQVLREIYVSLPPAEEAASPPAGNAADEKSIEDRERASQLGLWLQWTPLALSDVIFHVLEIIPSSPAYLAGLQANADYIIGIAGGNGVDDAHHALVSETSLADALEANLGHSLTLWVYNQDFNTTRLAEIVPERGWGGEGVLGCGIGFGYLHRLPEWRAGLPVPGETIFAADEGEEEDTVEVGAGGVPVTQTELMFKHLHIKDSESDTATPPTTAAPNQPTSSTLQPPPTSSAPPTDGASPAPYVRRKHHGHTASIAAGAQLDAYFDEQERISKETDYHASGGTESAAPLLPPPKDSEIRRQSSVVETAADTSVEAPVAEEAEDKNEEGNNEEEDVD
ncbi:GRASP55/65 PDZ-like domain-containing protein [Limtongia smithiae]|uniref:GRASP55/65 PDZ-like domain-containing protein n=1 Tax=Limtongia smithiae TaxID=1125753 RepID=UPI0034CEF112